LKGELKIRTPKEPNTYHCCLLLCLLQV